MSSRQFTILLSLCILSFCTILYIALFPTTHVPQQSPYKQEISTHKDFGSGRIIVVVKKDMSKNNGQGLPDTNVFVEYFSSQVPGDRRTQVTYDDGTTTFEGVPSGHYLLRLTSGLFQRQFVGFFNFDSTRVKSDTVKF